MAYAGYKFRKPESADKLQLLLTAITDSGHVGITRAQLSSKLSIHMSTVSPYTDELRERDLVYCVRDRYEVRWFIGPNPGAEPKPKKPRTDRGWRAKQPTVSTWTPNHSRDPLVAFLFGASK